jgi:hypothetical protein
MAGLSFDALREQARNWAFGRWVVIAAAIIGTLFLIIELLGHAHLYSAFWRACVAALLAMAALGVGERFWGGDKLTSADAGGVGVGFDEATEDAVEKAEKVVTELNARLNAQMTAINERLYDLGTIPSDKAHRRSSPFLRLLKPRFRSIVLLAALALPGCGKSAELACTAVGCNSGIEVSTNEVAKTVKGAAWVTLCIGGDCETERASAANVIGREFPKLGRDRRGDGSYEVTVTISDRRGAALLVVSHLVRHLRVYQPNGAACGPTCHYAGLELRARSRQLVQRT